MIESRFWDTSSVVPLCCHQPTSAALYRLLRPRDELVVWWGTPVEVASTLARLVRERMLTAAGQRQAWDTLARIRRTWVEIPADLEVRETAERLPARYGLKTGDALQLAAALVWCHGFPRGRSFVCGDHLLAQAAENAGFTVLFYEV